MEIEKALGESFHGEDSVTWAGRPYYPLLQLVLRMMWTVTTMLAAMGFCILSLSGNSMNKGRKALENTNYYVKRFYWFMQ